MFSMLLVVMTGSADAQTTLVKAGTVHTMNGKSFSPGAVLIVDGKIKAVGKSLNAENATVRDLGENSVVIPGMVNAYSQAGLTTAQSDERTNEITPNFTVIDGINWKSLDIKQRLMSGTTTSCVSPGTANVIGGITCVIKLAGDPKQRVVAKDGALVVNLCSDPASGNRSRSRPDSIFIRQPTNRMGVVWMLRNSFFKSGQPDESELKPVREMLANERKAYVISRKDHDILSIYNLAKEFPFQPIVVGGQEAYKIADVLAEKKTPVLLGPLLKSTSGPERSEMCWNQAGILSKAGVEISLTGRDLLSQIRFAHRYGLEKEKALEAVTTSPAKILGLQERVGKIAVGMDADLVAFDADPFELTSEIQFVMVDGKTIELQKED